MRGYSVTLPRRSLRQPQPNMNPGGDCAACALGGALGLTVPEVYARLREGKIQGATWFDARDALHRARAAGLADRIIVDVPIWPWAGYEPRAWFGLAASAQAMPWFAHLRMALDAGYYGIAEVSYRRAGPLGLPDHQVLLCGVREVWPEEGVGGVIRHEVLVSCSAGAAEEWVDVDDFLTQRGGFNVLLVRPTP